MGLVLGWHFALVLGYRYIRGIVAIFVLSVIVGSYNYAVI